MITIKTSAGAVEYMKIARVNNINETIKFLKEEGIWICGTDMETNTLYYEQDYNMPIASFWQPLYKFSYFPLL